MTKNIILLSLLFSLATLFSCKNEKVKVSATAPTIETLEPAAEPIVTKKSSPYEGIWIGPKGSPIIEITKPTKTEFVIRQCDDPKIPIGVTYPALFGRGTLTATGDFRNFPESKFPKFNLMDGPSLLFVEGDWGKVTLFPTSKKMPDIEYRAPR